MSIKYFYIVISSTNNITWSWLHTMTKSLKLQLPTHGNVVTVKWANTCIMYRGGFITPWKLWLCFSAQTPVVNVFKIIVVVVIVIGWKERLSAHSLKRHLWGVYLWAKYSYVCEVVQWRRENRPHSDFKSRTEIMSQLYCGPCQGKANRAGGWAGPPPSRPLLVTHLLPSQLPVALDGRAPGMLLP